MIDRRRRSIRLPAYDYTSQGAYFVTVCAHQRRPAFADGCVREVLEGTWRDIPDHFPAVIAGQFVVMPNHVHGILWITAEDTPGNVGARHASPLRSAIPHGAPSGSLGAVVGSFKAAAAPRISDIRNTSGAPVWQRNYYERVIRSGEELARIREYIQLNPSRWHFDRENPRRIKDARHEQEWAWLEGNTKVGALHAAPLGRPGHLYALQRDQ